MQAVRSKNTGPEMAVRKLLHAAGYRYRLHRSDLPGCPDIVFPGRRKVIFIHGCFWHGHDCQRGARVPKSNSEYWIGKIKRNRVRHVRALEHLREDGWRGLTVWECQMKNAEVLLRRLKRFLS